jgi:undecaprenyl diphosphate synthase
MAASTHPDIRRDYLPGHLAIIMDGNGRWARSRGWRRVLGHEQGANAVRRTAEECVRLGIPYLTLYAFSSENWCRPANEIETLMDLLVRFLDREEALLHQHRIRLHTIGHLHRLPAIVQQRVREVCAATADYDQLLLTLALIYGGRDEIVDACRRIAQRVAAGELATDAIDRQLFADALDTHGMPDVDLVIRTAGEHRMSNFLPWQTSYAEYVSVEHYWPDFDNHDLQSALQTFAQRQRRFGGVGDG